MATVILPLCHGELMKEYNIKPNNSVSENPIVLVDKSLHAVFNGEPCCLRVALLTADNREVPYWLIQLFTNYSSPDFKCILSHALYPTREILEYIHQGLLTSVDHVVGGLKLIHTKGLRVYRVDNGELYTEMLYNSLDIVDKRMSPIIDAAITTWLNNNPI